MNGCASASSTVSLFSGSRVSIRSSISQKFLFCSFNNNSNKEPAGGSYQRGQETSPFLEIKIYMHTYIRTNRGSMVSL